MTSVETGINDSQPRTTDDEKHDNPDGNVKKKPGRPRKKPLRSTIQRTGISSVPKREDNVIEFVYNEPLIFKRVIGIFKAAAAKELLIEFDVNEVRIITSDHVQKSDILVVFDCTKMAHYYRGEHVSATLNSHHIEQINQVLDKNYCVITIIVKRTNMRSALTIVFQNDMKIDEVREIRHITPTVMHQFRPDDFNYSGHAISFELPSKFFKKFISDTCIFSEVLTIQKIGSAPLTFLYNNEDKMIKSQCIVKDEQLIKLESSVEDDDIFSISVMIDYIKPFASSLLAETARIFVDSTKKILFVSELDNRSIVVKVASTIEKYVA